MTDTPEEYETLPLDTMPMAGDRLTVVAVEVSEGAYRRRSVHKPGEAVDADGDVWTKGNGGVPRSAIIAIQRPVKPFQHGDRVRTPNGFEARVIGPSMKTPGTLIVESASLVTWTFASSGLTRLPAEEEPR